MPALSLCVPGHAPSQKLRDLTRGDAEPRCWRETAQAIIAGEGMLDGEIANAFREMVARADRSDVRPNWSQVLWFIQQHYPEYVRHGAKTGGDRACPGLSDLLDGLGAAANAAK